jgi:aspartyl-tRNA synthetase
VFRLRGGSKDAIEIDSAELARQREERKKAKAEEKLKKKLAKEARAECTAGGASGGVVGPTGDTEGASGDTAASCGGPEVSYTTAGGLPEAHFGNLRLVQSRDQDALPQSHLDTLRSLNSLAGFDVGQPVWVRARVQNVRFKGNSCFLVLRDGTDTLQATLFKSADVYILQKITRGDMMQ